MSICTHFNHLTLNDIQLISYRLRSYAVKRHKHRNEKPTTYVVRWEDTTAGHESDLKEQDEIRALWGRLNCTTPIRQPLMTCQSTKESTRSLHTITRKIFNIILLSRMIEMNLSDHLAKAVARIFPFPNPRLPFQRESFPNLRLPLLEDFEKSFSLEG